jgi:hypothetical protein
MIPPATPLGSYFVLACADDLHAVTESSERNNCRSSMSGLTVSNPKPDLVVRALGNPPADGSNLTSFVVSITTGNVGRQAAGPSKTGLLLSLDAVRGHDLALGGRQAVPRLEPLTGTHQSSVQVSVPDGIAPGAYHLLACADITGLVSEAAESNNCRASSGTMVVTPAEPPSSQDLIAEDLDAGIIDYPTSLEYRTWALFRDPRLPARYGDQPSAGEDEAMFDELETQFDSLPTAIKAAIEPYLVAPNDPQSAFGPADALLPVTSRPAAGNADADSASDTHCRLPATWRYEEWTPAGGGADDGFRVWVCAASDVEASSMIDPVIAAASQLWEPMTRAEPNGMGKPIPSPGKTRIWILYTSDCVDRSCPLFDPDDSFRLGLEETQRETCHSPGYPPKSCSGSISLNAGVVCPATMPCFTSLKAVLAHEFFHVLQDAHNADAWAIGAGTINGQPILDKSWYSEASAEWAAWHFADDPQATSHFEKSFQTNNGSLLQVGAKHEYGSWVWPLMMQQELGSSSVFQSWQAAESAADPKGIDDAVDGVLGFGQHFRDFSVRNLNAGEYFAGGASGLEDDIWQTDLQHFSTVAHAHGPKGVIGLGDQDLFVEVAALAAEDDEYAVTDPRVRQITIDIAPLVNAQSADVDLVGRLASHEPGQQPTWRRMRGSGTSLTLCRDFPTQNFDLIYVVLSNHARARGFASGPATAAALKGAYQITGKNACDAPDHFDGTFSGFMGQPNAWSGHATFDLLTAASTCTDPLHSPPTTHDVHYCYRLTGGEVRWTWTPSPTDTCTYDWDDDAPNPGTFALVPEPFDQDFATKVDLVTRSSDPDEVGTYAVSISPYPILADQMRGSVTCDGHTSRTTRYADNLEGAWLFTGGSGPQDIGTGWALAGTVTLCLGSDCQGWTWNLQPSWDAE